MPENISQSLRDLRKDGLTGCVVNHLPPVVDAALYRENPADYLYHQIKAVQTAVDNWMRGDPVPIADMQARITVARALVFAIGFGLQDVGAVVTGSDPGVIVLGDDGGYHRVWPGPPNG